MNAKPPQDANLIVAVRNDYAGGKPLDLISADHRVTRTTIYRFVDGCAETEALGLAPMPRRRSGKVVPRRHPRFRGDRYSLVNRIWRAAATQVHDIETRIVNATQKPEERERDARALAVMVKTLRELAVLDEERAARRTEVSADDSEPVDLDEFRRELARRMHAFIDQRTGGRVPRDPDEQAE